MCLPSFSSCQNKHKGHLIVDVQHYFIVVCWYEYGIAHIIAGNRNV